MNSHGKCRIHIGIAVLCLLCARGMLGQSNAYFEQSTPEAQGLSSRAILSFIEKAEQEIDAIHSYMIIRHGKMIAKGWWAPYGAEVPHVLHSLSKSFTSTAIGFAVDEGLLSLNDPVVSFFPEEGPAEPSWQLKAMRVRDLITMNTGHIQEPRPAAQDKNWVKTFLASEVELTPGTHFKYNSMATYMLSAILQKVTGKTLVDFLAPRLFQPLRIKQPHWDSCPMGINTGGWGLRVVTEDIAKLGQLYLQKGRWGDKQLLSKAWVDMATSKQVSNGSNPENDWNQGYGFQFWMCRHNCYRGDGAMGQFCIVMPEQDAVVAITSGTNNMARVMQLVWDILLPAMKPGSLAPDEAQFSKLVQKNAGLSLKPVAGEKTSAISARVSRRRHRLEENAAGIKFISFELHEGAHRIAVEMEHGTERVHIGTQAYVKNELNDHMPYTSQSLKKIAASGAWTSPALYQARIYLYESPAKINYTFSFEEDRLVWKTKLEQSLFGPRTPEPLTGKQE